MRRISVTEVRLLWCATIAAMTASWSHLASWIASWEYAGASAWVIGCVAATAVDLGILSAMMAQDRLAASGASTTGPRRTVALLAFVSALANMAHALDARATRVGAPDAALLAQAVRVAGAVVVAGVLPLIVIRLSHLLDTVTRADDAPMTHPASQPAAPDASQEAGAATRRRASGARRSAAERDTSATLTRVAEAAARVAPGASGRALAVAAGVSEATVRRMIADGALTHGADGWRVAA